MTDTDTLLLRPGDPAGAYCSVDRQRDWRQAYLLAMGYDDWQDADAMETEETVPTTKPPQRLVISNLVSTEEDSDTNEKDNSSASAPFDSWTATALEIATSITDMASWIRQKRRAYVSVDALADPEASLIQSTVTSFAATTAQEIESLRQLIGQTGTSSSNNNSMRHQHETSIVQILLTRLADEIAKPFGVLQKQRHRPAVEIWQHPLSCRLVVSSGNKPKAGHERGRSRDEELDALLGLPESHQREAKQQLFLPKRPSHRLQQHFVETYQRAAALKVPERPVSLFSQPDKKRTLAPSQPSSPDDKKRSKPTPSQPQPREPFQQRTPVPSVKPVADDPWNDNAIAAEELEAEAAMLTALLHNDLDSVQQMEQAMVDITTLLSQFSDLVAEQQEDVYDIADATAAAKDNMEKGQENLVDATERTKQSKHRLASAIMTMSTLLLLFHWLRP